MRTNEITFESSQTQLAGTMTRPEGPGPHAAALVLAGSGPLDRDGNIKRMPLGVSRDLAELLAEWGWASLRFDKRGIGESAGDYHRTGFHEELADAEAALTWLKSQPDIGPIVVIGHSAGAIYAGEIAARHPDIAGAVLVSTSAKTGEETLIWQAAQMQDVIVPAPVKLLLKVFRTSVVKQQAKALRKLKATTGDVARIQLVKVNAKWMREFMEHDPLPSLRDAKVPLLAITGTKDIQVDVTDLAEIAATAPDGTTTAAIADVDHILRHEPADTSNPRKYKKQLAKPISPDVVAALKDWLAGVERHISP